MPGPVAGICIANNTAMANSTSLKHVRTSTLDIAYKESSMADCTPVIVLHGWSYVARVYDAVVPLLFGCRVIMPYLRSFGPTRFLSDTTPPSGHQAQPA